jgi:signal transduction histidine kinase
MTYVGVLDDWQGGWAASGPRIAAAPYAPALGGALLGLLALAESVPRVVAGGLDPKTGLALCLLSLATTLPLGFLRPPAATVAVTVAAVLSLAAFRALTVAGLAALLIAGYRLGRAGRWALAVAAAAPFPVLALAGRPGGEAGVLSLLLASLAPVAALAGIAQRARHEAAENRAAREVIASTLLDHSARGERARIARELHDVVAHHISMIAVQAETARLTTAGMPAAGAQRLLAIGDTARAALTEMRRLLGVLREDARAEPPDRQPQPGLRELNKLIDSAREASGAGTRLIVRGRPASLDPGVELAAYRIIQEALTNARRHAPGAAVDVELHYADDVLRLQVRDNGPGPSPAPAAPGPGPAAAGHGLAGMRERAIAVGGELRTGRTPGGGFLIDATLPAKNETA